MLVHILGVYQISWTKTNRTQFKNRYVVVMPNLWYSKNITKQFDLKGSLRNRYIHEGNADKQSAAAAKNGDGKKSKTVLLNKNSIQYMKGFPMTLEDQSKQHLHKAVHNDTLFLCRSDVIDYSLLVGINESENELVVGIIDYLRTYTWDKAVEEQAKSIGMVIGKQAPTIQRPKTYKQVCRLLALCDFGLVLNSMKMDYRCTHTALSGSHGTLFYGVTGPKNETNRAAQR